MEISTEVKGTQAKKYKFLRRTVTLSKEKLVLSKIRLRKLHLKSIRDYGGNSRFYHYLKWKEMQCVQSLSLSEDIIHYFPFLRNLKILKKVRLSISRIQSLQIASHCLKMLPKDIEAINFQGEGLDQYPDKIQRAYRTLGSFTKLKKLKMSFNYFDGTVGNMEINYRLANRYLARLRKLAEFDLDCNELFHFDLQEIKLKRVCPVVTSLSFIMFDGLAEDYDAIKERLEEETSEEAYQEADEDESLEDNSEETIEDDPILKLSADIALLFRFDHLPNLKKLKITFYEECLFPLDSSITQAFESLKQLKQLEIDFPIRCKGTNAILKGFLNLPLLTEFWFKIPFVKTSEYGLLTEFFQKQTHLVSIRFQLYRTDEMSKTCYQDQNTFFENIWKCLENKPHLKYLLLTSNYGNLESISKGLAQTGRLDKIESFWLELIDDFVTGSLPASERVKGLCDFMKRHKHSLRNLLFSFQFVVDDDIVYNISSAITELDSLISLNFQINSEMDSSEVSEYLIFFEEMFDKDMFKIMSGRELTFNRTFDVLNEVLKKMTKLRALGLHFNYLMRNNKVDNVSKPHSSKILPTLTNLADLQFLDINLPLLDKEFENHPERVVFIKKLASKVPDFIALDRFKNILELDEILYRAQQKRSLKCELQF